MRDSREALQDMDMADIVCTLPIPSDGHGFENQTAAGGRHNVLPPSDMMT